MDDNKTNDEYVINIPDEFDSTNNRKIINQNDTQQSNYDLVNSTHASVLSCLGRNDILKDKKKFKLSTNLKVNKDNSDIILESTFES
jgi:hypothetical protein